MSHIEQLKGKQVTLTFNEVLETVAERRPCSRATLKRYLKTLGIKPAGLIQTRPRRYSGETPAKILEALGEPRVVSLRELRAERRKARRAA